MASRSICQRLKHLEARTTLQAVGEPMIIEVRFVSPDKVVTSSLSIQIP
jgi:hypothetical protein